MADPIVVYIPGVWDLLHVGHLTILERAKSLGDRLVVGVPSDDIVEEDKGYPPTIRLYDRMRMLQALKCVDLPVAYHHLEFITHLNAIWPDILIVGATWGDEQRHKDAERWVKVNHKRIVELPYSPKESTTRIRKRIAYLELKNLSILTPKGKSSE